MNFLLLHLHIFADLIIREAVGLPSSDSLFAGSHCTVDALEANDQVTTKLIYFNSWILDFSLFEPNKIPLNIRIEKMTIEGDQPVG